MNEEKRNLFLSYCLAFMMVTVITGAVKVYSIEHRMDQIQQQENQQAKMVDCYMDHMNCQ